MERKLFGIRNLTVHHAQDEITTIQAEFVAEPGYNADELYQAKWQDLFPSNVIVKCSHCGQWAARKTECKHCGAPVS